MNKLVKQALPLVDKVREISDQVLTRHIKREDVVKATWLALVSGHPAFFLGSPGIDKTKTIKAMLRSIVDATFREELMPTLSTGAQLLVEGTALKEASQPDGSKMISTVDKLGAAAAVDVFFADEVWKTEDAVLKVLFDLFNLDDVRYDGQLVANQLMTFLAASNELPDSEGKLYALWSRMTIRVVVNSLDRGGKRALVQARLTRDRAGKQQQAASPLTLADIKLLRQARPFVEVPADIVEIVLDILQELVGETGQDFQWAWDDDRRFGRIFDVMQANALLAGRSTIVKADLVVLEWLLWDTPEQIAVVKTKIAPYIRTPLTEAQEMVDSLMVADGHVAKVLAGEKTKVVQAVTQCDDAATELKKLVAQATDGAMRTGIETFIQQVAETKNQVIAVLTGTPKA